jgi:hypothetical protein
MQQKPDDGMAEAAPKAAAVTGPELGFWLAARRRLAPDDPFFAAGDLERELLAKHVRFNLPSLFPSLYPVSASTHADPCCERVGTACLRKFLFHGHFGVMPIPMRASRFLAKG